MTQTLKLSSNVVTTQAMSEPLTIKSLSNTVDKMTSGYVNTLGGTGWVEALREPFNFQQAYWGIDYGYEPLIQKELNKYLKEIEESEKKMLNDSIKEKEDKMADVKVKTVELFSGKSEDDQLLESYKVVDEAGDLTQTGWMVIGKLLLAEKKQAIVDKLKADRDSKKKGSESTPSA